MTEPFEKELEETRAAMKAHRDESGLVDDAYAQDEATPQPRRKGAARATEEAVELIRKTIEMLDPAGSPALRDACIKEAIKANVDPVVEAQLIKALGKRLGVRNDLVQTIWNRLEIALADENRATPEQAQADAKADRHKVEADRAELYARCGHIAESRSLLKDMVDLVQRMGVIAEKRGIVSIYLTASSRLHRQGAISLLRRGAAASGKNHATEIVFELFPKDSIIRATGGSPKALIYYGGVEEPDALKHKVVYVPEAAAIADKGSVEAEFTTMLRVLISENRIDHQVVQTKENSTPITVSVIKHGPIAVVMTSARNNVEDEMLTRLMVSDADESSAQTRAIITNTLGGRGPAVPQEEIGPWVAFQSWLKLGGPYEVSVPFLTAIDRAYGYPAKTPLRIRRDMANFVRAIMASAIVHSAQRQRDDAGRIVAELADYASAYHAFDLDMSGLYAHSVPATIAAVVAAIEELVKEEQDKEPLASDAKVTYKILRSKLGISSNDTAGSRLNEAVERA